MAIIDSIRDTLNALESSFKKAKECGVIPPEIDFRPVACLKDKKSNLYEMFCLGYNGQRLKQVKSIEFRPTISSTTYVQEVRWENEWQRYVNVNVLDN